MAASKVWAFLFTDIVGSSRLWESDPQGMSDCLLIHNEALLRVFTEFYGDVFKSLGDGYCVAFESPVDALNAALAAQNAVASIDWPEGRKIAIKVGIHAGLAQSSFGDYFGPAVNRTARLCSLAAGGQILMSASSWNSCADYIDKRVRFADLGSLQLKGMDRPEHVFMVGDVSGAAGFTAAIATKPEAKHNIPPLERAFVGRFEEIAEIENRLKNPDERLVSIIGFGGLGKTSLAKIVGLKLENEFAGGVWFVDCDSLAGVDDLMLACRSLPNWTGMEDGRTTKPPTLLILDCFEGIVRSAAYLDGLLAAQPNLKILVTSRAVLHSQYEHVFELKPLSGAKRQGAEPDGVQLFALAARQADGQFALSRANRSEVVRLVEAVENIPLAIVLAAGRLRHMSLGELFSEVETSMLSVVKGPESAFGKHKDFSRVIESSLTLLDEADQQLAKDLSVFEGGFAIRDARSVLPDVDDLMDSLSRLKDHSLLVTSVRQDSMRYRQLDTVREFMRTLESERSQLVAERHARHYGQRSAEVGEMYRSGAWQQGAHVLLLELANFRKAVAWAKKSGDSTLLKSMAQSLSRAYMEGGLLHEFLDLLEAAEAVLDPVTEPELLIELMGLKGAYLFRERQTDVADAAWAIRESACEAAGLLEQQADTILDRASVAMSVGNSIKVSQHLDRFDGLALKLKGSPVVASGQVMRAVQYLEDGDVEDPLDLARQIESENDLNLADVRIPYICLRLSELYRECGKPEESLRIIRNVLRNSLDGNLSTYACLSLVELAKSFEKVGHVENALMALHAAQNIDRGVTKSAAAKVMSELERLKKEYGIEKVEAARHAVVEFPWDSIASRFVDPIMG